MPGSSASSTSASTSPSASNPPRAHYSSRKSSSTVEFGASGRAWPHALRERIRTLRSVAGAATRAGTGVVLLTSYSPGRVNFSLSGRGRGALRRRRRGNRRRRQRSRRPADAVGGVDTTPGTVDAPAVCCGRGGSRRRGGDGLRGGGVEMSGTAGCPLDRQPAGDERHRLLRVERWPRWPRAAPRCLCTCEAPRGCHPRPPEGESARALRHSGTSQTTENEPLVDRKGVCGVDVSGTKPPTSLWQPNLPLSRAPGLEPPGDEGGVAFGGVGKLRAGG